MDIDKVLAITALSLVTLSAAEAPVAVTSPNGQVELRLSSDPSGRLRWAVKLKGHAVIEESPIGITLDGVNLADGEQIGKTETYRVEEKYPWYGAHSIAADNCRGVRIAMKHGASGTSYTLEMRAYDDGVAFRHLVPAVA